MSKLIVFDCDSTLSEIEGVDELARAKGADVFNQCVQLTNDAMDGSVPIADVFAKRLDLIQPTEALCQEVGQLYIQKIESSAKETIATLQKEGWDVVILSGGFSNVIQPFAAHLNIAHIEAVPLFFNADGSYQGFDERYPTTRNGGKPEIIHQLLEKYQPETSVMVGDGVSDLETQEHVSKFIGFGGFTPREKVKAKAKHYITQLSDLLDIV